MPASLPVAASAASAPICSASLALAKSAVVTSVPSAGTISTSCSPSRAVEVRVLPTVSMPVSWEITCSMLASASSGASGVPTSTAMTTSAPIRRTVSIGTCSAMPPSMSTCPSIVTGWKMPGSDIEARMASARLPLPSSTGWPVLRSVPMARNGIGSRSKSETVLTARVLRSNIDRIRSPCSMPGLISSLPLPRPMPRVATPSRSSCLRR